MMMVRVSNPLGASSHHDLTRCRILIGFMRNRYIPILPMVLVNGSDGIGTGAWIFFISWMSVVIDVIVPSAQDGVRRFRITTRLKSSPI